MEYQYTARIQKGPAVWFVDMRRVTDVFFLPGKSFAIFAGQEQIIQMDRESYAVDAGDIDSAAVKFIQEWRSVVDSMGVREWPAKE